MEFSLTGAPIASNRLQQLMARSRRPGWYDEAGHAHQSSGEREESLSAAARAQPGGLVSLGRGGIRKSARENKPIFLSIGYSTCHWCHVMEREIFENETIAALLNETTCPSRWIAKSAPMSTAST